MLAIIIAIIIVSFSVAGISMFYFLDHYVSGDKVHVLEQSGDRINTVFSTYFQNRDNPLALLYLRNMLETYGTSTGAMIWIVRNDGSIVYPDRDSIPRQIAKNLSVNNSGDLQLPDARQYRKIMSGTENELMERGDFYGLFKDTGYTWLTVEKPIIMTDENGKKTLIAATYLIAPISEINRTRTTVFNFFILSTCVSVLISIILAYIFSRRLSKPLKEINAAARVIAGGEFSKRLNIKSRDEIGELAASFNQMVVALQNLEDMRRGFIANVSHELRTPMTSIRGFIEGILDGTIPPEKQKGYLNIVRDETNRLNRLVNDLLDLARMEAGEVKLSMKQVEINELIRICIIKLESLIINKNINIKANFDEEEMLVTADSDAIERVIINLIHNAIKFSNENGTITIKTESRKDKVIVSVKDEGIGIAEEEIRQIWDRFYKSDKSRSKDKTGTGLGLAIVKNIINEHGQEVWVESEPGKGSTFYFSLKKAE